MKNTYFAIFYSHDGAVLVEMENYEKEMTDLLEKASKHYSLGGVIKGDFVTEKTLGVHLISLKTFVEGLILENNLKDEMLKENLEKLLN